MGIFPNLRGENKQYMSCIEESEEHSSLGKNLDNPGGVDLQAPLPQQGVFSWIFNQPPPAHVPPTRNKGWIFGLIKGNQWLINPDHKAGYFLGVNVALGGGS